MSFIIVVKAFLFSYANKFAKVSDVNWLLFSIAFTGYFFVLNHRYFYFSSFYESEVFIIYCFTSCFDVNHTRYYYDGFFSDFNDRVTHINVLIKEDGWAVVVSKCFVIKVIFDGCRNKKVV